MIIYTKAQSKIIIFEWMQSQIRLSGSFNQSKNITLKICLLFIWISSSYCHEHNWIGDEYWIFFSVKWPKLCCGQEHNASQFLSNHSKIRMGHLTNPCSCGLFWKARYREDENSSDSLHGIIHCNVCNNKAFKMYLSLWRDLLYLCLAKVKMGCLQLMEIQCQSSNHFNAFRACKQT